MLEKFLARLYTDDALLARFLADPYAIARECGLDDATAREVAKIDRESLTLAARSFERKRRQR